MKEVVVEYEGQEGFTPKYWIHLKNIDFSASTISGMSTIVISPEQAEMLQEGLSQARQEAEYQKICVKNQ